ncbi:serine/threonine-protein kinase [Pararoseomonas sp. SCSIO 73927]|uniref:serine/threonine-protein kinase n=1 Tax=Pararoseomonas sp. SCSIO 73927 TaxID=3114537 RepID=UPI0030D2A063
MTSGDPPLSAILRAIGRRIEAGHHPPNDAARARHAERLDEIVGRMAQLQANLSAVLGEEPSLVPGLPRDLAAVSAERADRAEAALAAAESLAGDAARRRARGVLLMVSGDLSVLDRVAALRDEAVACARAGRRAWQRTGAILAGSSEEMPVPQEQPLPIPLPPSGDEESTVRSPLPSAAPVLPAALPETGASQDGAGAPLPGLRRILANSFRFGEDRLLLAGRYEIRDLIGRGSFGTVLEAFDQSLGRLVAVKVMDMAQAASPEDAPERAEQHERFRREARAVGRLSHPGIVPVFDFGEVPDAAWIVMELVIGETLQVALRRDGPMVPPEARRIATELLEALSFAHGRGIVHRDVKAANVLLAATSDHGHGAVRLVDFGVARLEGSQATLVGEMVGTLSTMSPEQVRGGPVDHRADLWAAGVVLYQMLTGTRPFEGTSAALMNAILTEDPEPPSRRVPGVPAGYDAVIRRALAKPAEARFASAAEFIAALREIGATPAGPGRADAVQRGGFLARSLRRGLAREP